MNSRIIHTQSVLKPGKWFCISHLIDLHVNGSRYSLLEMQYTYIRTANLWHYTSLAPRPHPACILLPVKAICDEVDFRSGMETSITPIKSGCVMVW